MRPSRGILETTGLIPNWQVAYVPFPTLTGREIDAISPHLDTVGSMGRSAYDIALHLDVLSGKTSLTAALESEAVPTVGVHDAKARPSEEEELLVQVFTKWPGRITWGIRLDHFHTLVDNEDVPATYCQGSREAWSGYLANTDGPLRSLEDIVDWHDQHPVCHCAAPELIKDDVIFSRQPRAEPPARGA